MFRDSIDFDDLIVDEERASVKRVTNEFFARKYHNQNNIDVKLTYIVVKKNTKLEYVPVDKPDRTHAQPLDDYLAEGDNIGKYRYYIMTDEAHRGSNRLANLTSCLNESSQLTPQYEQTAKAFPLL